LKWRYYIFTKYMLKALKETPDQFSDLSMISHADVDDSVDVCRKLISRLYDPKGKSKRCHSDLEFSTGQIMFETHTTPTAH
jgi:hypothetical protein